MFVSASSQECSTCSQMMACQYELGVRPKSQDKRQGSSNFFKDNRGKSVPVEGRKLPTVPTHLSLSVLSVSLKDVAQNCCPFTSTSKYH